LVSGLTSVVFFLVFFFFAMDQNPFL